MFDRPTQGVSWPAPPASVRVRDRFGILCDETRHSAATLSSFVPCSLLNPNCNDASRR
jgi:hypothetical protein